MLLKTCSTVQSALRRGQTFFGGQIFTRGVFYGPRQELIEEQLRRSFPKAESLEVTNESHGGLKNESHFHVHVVSLEFEGKKLLERQRIVNGVFTESDGNLPFHSLRITAHTPEQAAKLGVPAAPKCKGGDGSGMFR